MQTSMVFSQRAWPGWGGTLNDCAVVSAVQAVNVTSPWLPLYGVKAFRKAAEAPDTRGLTIAQIARGIRTLYPVLAGSLKVSRGDPWSQLVAYGEQGRPLTVAVDASRLAPELQFGFDGRHQVTLAIPDHLKGSGNVLYANPLASPYARWLRVRWSDLRDAVMGFGKLVDGSRGAWAVALPTDSTAYALWREWTDETPYDKDDIDAATAALQARIDAAREALDPEGGVPA